MKTNNINFKKIQIILLFVLLVIENIYSVPTCDIGYNYESGVGCRPSSSPVLTLAYCYKSRYDAYQGLGGTASSPCSGGYATYYQTTHTITTNSVSLFSCAGNIEGIPTNYMATGSCLPGDNTAGSIPYLFNSVNRYWIQSRCDYVATGMEILGPLTSYYYDANTQPNGISTTAIYRCSIVAGPGPGVLSDVKVWDSFGIVKCPVGYSGTLPCTDTDECLANNGGCDQVCKNNDGSDPTCSCNTGYSLGTNGKSCDDNNECNLGTHQCTNGATCSNTVGSYECKCELNGYKLSSNGKSCEDINECIDSPNSCQGNAQCQNSNGSFSCSCPQGFEVTSNKTACQDIDECSLGTHQCTQGTECQNLNGSYECLDIDECSSPTTNNCSENTVCSNTQGGYICECSPSSYSHSTPFKCLPKPIISSFYQLENSISTFIIIGNNFGETTTTVSINSTVNCAYKSGNSTHIECLTSVGLEVKGGVIVTSNNIESDIYQFIGAPFITGYSTSPSTEGGDITISGNNFPITGTLSLTINSNNCPISSNSINEIICKLSEGSGKNNLIKLTNGLVSNTDSQSVVYANPTIISTSVVYQNGGILTVTGNNFGISTNNSQLVTLDIGGNQQCKNVNVLSHSKLTCNLGASDITYTQLLVLIVDSLPTIDDYYFTFSSLEGIEQCQCNNHGKCTSFGCTCDFGYTGHTCNETSIGGIIKPNSTNPSVEIVDNINSGNFGYMVSVVRIEELDFNQNIITSIQLSNESWEYSNPSTTQWSFNITLSNKSYLEASYEYFKQSTVISFAKNSIDMPGNSLKLSFKTIQWPFKSKLSTLRIIVQTDTLILDGSENECSISTPVNNKYNQNVWSTTINPDNGITTRFISAAEVDGHSITANIELLPSPSRTSSLVGLSLPYFVNQSIIDPDFSLLLTNSDSTTTGICESNNNSNSNWKIATGVTIGGVAAVSASVATLFFLKKRAINKKFVGQFKNASN